jgi:hypothetical protein
MSPVPNYTKADGGEGVDRYGLLHGEDANEVIANAEMIPFRFDVGIDHLKIEVLWSAIDAPFIEVQ